MQKYKNINGYKEILSFKLQRLSTTDEQHNNYSDGTNGRMTDIDGL